MSCTRSSIVCPGDHDARSHLIAGLAKVGERFVAVFEYLLVLARRAVKPVKEFGIARFDAKQIAKPVGIAARLGPVFVDLERLLPERERDAEPLREGLRAAHFVNVAKELADEGHPLRIPAFARLNGDGAVPALEGEAGALENRLARERVALHVVVGLADAAVAAVGRAYVADLDEAAQIDVGAHFPGRQVIGAALQKVGFFGRSDAQNPRDFFVGELGLREEVFKSFHGAFRPSSRAFR